MGLLSSVSKYYKMSFDKNVLIYVQRPDAGLLATKMGWEKQTGRYLKAGSKGIGVVDMNNPKATLAYYFDLADTRGDYEGFRRAMSAVWSLAVSYTHLDVYKRQPGLSAFVGGDITAGILASGMLEQEASTLLIDLGTNGEMALGNRHRLHACATAAGPAFEGGANRGIWGADMVRLLQKLLEEGLMDGCLLYTSIWRVIFLLTALIFRVNGK